MLELLGAAVLLSPHSLFSFISFYVDLRTSEPVSSNDPGACIYCTCCTCSNNKTINHSVPLPLLPLLKTNKSLKTFPLESREIVAAAIVGN